MGRSPDHLAGQGRTGDNSTTSWLPALCFRNCPMRFPATVAAVACLLLAVADPPKGQKAPQTTFEPRSSPGAGQRFLENFAGDWRVTKTFYPRAGGPIRAEGRCHQAMIHEGRFLQSD